MENISKEYKVVPFDSWEDVQSQLDELSKKGWRFIPKGLFTNALLFHDKPENAVVLERDVRPKTQTELLAEEIERKKTADAKAEKQRAQFLGLLREIGSKLGIATS